MGGEGEKLFREVRFKWDTHTEEGDLPNGNGDRTSLIIISFNLLDLLSETDEMAAEHLLRFGRQAGGAFAFAVRDVTFHLVQIDFALNIAVLVRPVHVDVHDVFGNRSVASLVMLVLDDEDHVETG